MFPDTPNNQEDPKGRLKIILPLVLLVALGVGGYLVLIKPIRSDYKIPATETSEKIETQISTTTSITHSDAPYNGEWGRISNMPGNISFDYPLFGSSIDTHVEIDRVSDNTTVLVLMKIIKEGLKPDDYYSQSQYALVFKKNLKRQTLEQWFKENMCRSEDLTELLKLTNLSNGVRILEIVGELPVSFIDNCGPVGSLLFATTPSADVIIAVNVGQEHSFTGLTDGYGLAKVFYSVLGSIAVENNKSLVTYDIPVGWTLVPSKEYGDNLYTFEAMQQIKEGDRHVGASVSINILENYRKLNLADFLKNYYEGLYLTYAEQKFTDVDGNTALYVSDESSLVPRIRVRGMLIQAEDKIFEITANQEVTKKQFDDFIKTIKINNSQ